MITAILRSGFLCTAASVFFLFVNCSILESDHTFSISKPHTSSPGCSGTDSMIVLKLLSMNDLSPKLFDSVALFQSDWRLHELKLSKRNIDTLPEEFGELGALTRLNLSYNNLRILPCSIIRLTLKNNLQINNNRMCSTTPELSSWIDKQFNKINYILTDTTQECR